MMMEKIRGKLKFLEEHLKVFHSSDVIKAKKVRQSTVREKERIKEM